MYLQFTFTGAVPSNGGVLKHNSRCHGVSESVTYTVQVRGLNRLSRVCLMNKYVMSLMSISCIIRRIRTDQQYALIAPLLHSTYWLLHVSAIACHQVRQSHVIWYTTRPICISSNSGGSNKLPDDGRLLPKHVGAST
jgi:hypothetical protein